MVYLYDKGKKKLGEMEMSQQYEIIIHGHLTPQWSVIFEHMEVTCLPDGNTRIAGSLPDQSALYGLLMHLRDFGITLISVRVVEPEPKKEK